MPCNEISLKADISKTMIMVNSLNKGDKRLYTQYLKGGIMSIIFELKNLFY